MSVDGPLAYADAKAGINKFDIARMIPYCFNVLNGTTPANNDRRITKSVALILIVHYVGDLHQPLHVGAAFFNSKAQRRAPKNDSDSNAKSDSGGNSVYFPLPTVVKKDSPNLQPMPSAPASISRRTTSRIWRSCSGVACLSSSPIT